MLKSRHNFANKGPSSQSYVFSSSHIWIGELDCKESWASKNWCILTVVLERTLESPLDCKEIQPVNPKGNQYWIFIRRTDAETPILWPPDAKNWFLRKDPDAGKGSKAREGDDRGWDGWMASLIWWDMGFSKLPGVGDGQGGLACYSHGVSESQIWLSIWTELNVIPDMSNWTELRIHILKLSGPVWLCMDTGQLKRY